MLVPIRSIRGKLLLSFLLFVLITCGIVILNVWLNGRREEVAQINARLNKVNFEIQRIKRIEGDFLKDEIINPVFYNTQESRYLHDHNRSLATVRENLDAMQNHREINVAYITQKIDFVRGKLSSYQHTFHKLQELILGRGFKDFGLEGKMRYYIHQIEQLTTQHKLDMAKMLTIRRIEKDFILRKEWHYTQDIIVALDAFRQDINEKLADFQAKKTMFELLANYQSAFQQIAYAERNIGFNNEAGIRSELSQYSKEIEENIEQLNKDITSITQDLSTQTISTFIGIIAVSVGLLLFFALFLTQTLSRPIRLLSENIHYVIQHNFAKNIDFQPLKTHDEIGRLSSDFGLMLSTVQTSIEQIQNQSEKIERKQHALLESMRYAHTIQQAILPDADDFQAHFDDYFVLYKPMHTVSGDFYWLAEQQNIVFLAVVDCTGHGVPGGFMSMVGNALLSKIVNEKEIFDTSLILALLDLEVKQALRQERDKNNDGMEVALCKFESLQNGSPIVKVTFSGAKGKMFYTKGDILYKEKSTRRAIGGKNEDNKGELEDFEQIELFLPKGEKIYLTSDGYCDQPNAKRKRLGTKNFMDILQNNLQKPLPVQGEILEKTLLEHLEDPHEQRDDITVVGVQV
jgi:HAMP domain-containing protein